MAAEKELLDIGHGNPTIFREWWESTELLFSTVAPPSLPLSAIYEYQEEFGRVSRTTHAFHALFGTDCPTASLVFGNGSTQVINAILYAIAKILGRSLVVGYATPVYMLMHEFLLHSPWITITHDLTRTDIDVEIVIDPNNPTGEHRHQQSNARYVIFDRAYNWPIYLTNTNPTPTSSAPNHITVYTISKALGMGGLRFGWAFINDPILTQEVGRSLVLLGICPNSFAMTTAIRVFHRFINDPALVKSYSHALRHTITVRRKLVQICSQFTVTNDSGPYAWISSKTGSDIAKYLLDAYKIKVYSGDQFGSTNKYARLSLICSEAEFHQATMRLMTN